MAERKTDGRERRRLGLDRLRAKLDLISTKPGITADEAERILVERGLTDDPEVLGREAEKRVARVIGKSPLVRSVRMTEPRSEEDLDGKDMEVIPRLRLRLLDKYYVQAKSSQEGVNRFRQWIADWLMSWREDLWEAKKSGPVEFKKRLDREVDEELLKRKIVVIIGGVRQTEDDILEAHAERVKALYSYWQARSGKA